MILLLDIEGTTTPIDFVHKRLFPFARERMDEFVAGNFDSLETEVSALSDEAKRDISEGIYTAEFEPVSAPSVAKYLRFLIDEDRKSTPLKSIQGKIWRDGYDSGELESEVYPDVPPAFERWHRRGDPVNIFSSGSVLAQKLLFGHTADGDLTQFISKYFDTNTGHKRETATYRSICRSLGAGGPDVVFISDVDAELDAAAAAGMRTRLSVRAGNPPQANRSGHKVIRSLSEVA